MIGKFFESFEVNYYYCLDLGSAILEKDFSLPCDFERKQIVRKRILDTKERKKIENMTRIDLLLHFKNTFFILTIFFYLLGIEAVKMS